MPRESKSVVLLKNVDAGLPLPENFQITTTPIEVDEAGSQIPDGGIFVELLAVSADPYLRGRIRSNVGSIKPGEAISGFVSGKIVISKNEKWKAGDLFGGSLPFTTYQILTPAQLGSTLLWKLTDLISEEEIGAGIGILGMPGATAYGGLLDVLRPKANETIFISACAGAVGGMVGMLAKNVFGCKVIGSCGGPEKVAAALANGFDHAIDYKKCETAEDIINAVKAFAPDGIDMYFENVGGIHFEAATALLKNEGW